MVELRRNSLRFSFPEVHEDAVMEISLTRTLRIPDDDRDYPLPPGLGDFPLRHIDDYTNRMPAAMVARGGVIMPMYQAEAIWIRFRSPEEYPFAVKVATGKINAVSGKAWTEDLGDHPQDYLAVPGQPWIDGYCVGKGIIRQFVAMPLGAGYTAEEQMSGKAEYGGIQLMVIPLRPELYRRVKYPEVTFLRKAMPVVECSMGLTPGGRMKQDLYDDPREISDYHPTARSRCFVHILNSLTWLDTTGEAPPQKPLTAAAYSEAGLPWFEWYSDLHALQASPELAKLKSALELSRRKEDLRVPEDEVALPLPVIPQGKVEGARIREWTGY
jgi:hypothetical protein